MSLRTNRGTQSTEEGQRSDALYALVRLLARVAAREGIEGMAVLGDEPQPNESSIDGENL